jgi:hypothetical protein
VGYDREMPHELLAGEFASHGRSYEAGSSTP